MGPFQGPLFSNVASLESLFQATLRDLAKNSLSLQSQAFIKRVNELHVLSTSVDKRGSDRMISYLPSFVAKTESSDNKLPRIFRIKSNRVFATGHEEGSLLSPVRALYLYMERTKEIVGHPSLFVSPTNRKDH